MPQQTNTDRLIEAGVLKSDHTLSEYDQQQIDSLSSEEVDHLISVGDKLDEEFYDRNSANFSRSNFI
ncbi:MAG: hypothetical protein ACREA9_03785 [Pyrinomonadaceae bacterium]